MKILFKILIILVVAVLVGGLFYGVVTAFSSGYTTQVSLSERPANPEFNRAERPSGAGGLQFPMDSMKNLLIISVIAVMYVHGSRWIKEIKGVPAR